MSGDEIESSQSNDSDDSQPPVTEVPVKVSRPRIKLDAERLLEDKVNGIQKVFEDFPKIDLLKKDEEVEAFRHVIQEYQRWAAELFPTGLNILDFARTAENELSGEARKESLLNYRVEHLRREGVFRTREEEDRLRKAEENRMRAMEKRRQKEDANRIAELMT